MLNQKVLDYVDCVMSNIDAPPEKKIHIENELIRYIVETSESTSVDEVKENLCSPKELADALSKRLIGKDKETLKQSCKETNTHECRHRNYQRYAGEYMQERSNVNIKLLYIPLLQISSGTQRIVMPLTDDDDD